MLMVTEPKGNLAQVYKATNAADLEVGDFVGYGDADALCSQIAPEVEGKWHLFKTAPGQENIAAGHLVGRRFGVLLPEISHLPTASFDDETGRWIVAKGEKLPRRRLMFVGYIFVFMWLNDKNYHRVLAVPGIQHQARWPDGKFFEPTDRMVNYIRSLEAILNPFDIPEDWITEPKRKRHSWRKKRRVEPKQDDPLLMRVAPKSWLNLGEDQWIEGVEALRVLDGRDENQSLARALGLAS